MKRVLLAATLMLAWSPASPAQTATTPYAFLKALYRHYTSDNPIFSPLGKYAPALFSDSLLALIRQDQNVAPGDSGRLDFDPVCDCQDFDGMRVRSIKISQQQNDLARADVELDFSGAPLEVKFALVKQVNGWRIADINDPDMPSLRAFLAGPK